MNTQTNDLVEYEAVSNCCGARVYADLGICSQCKEHCGTEEEDTTEAHVEQEVEAQERAEDRYDDSHEPTCGEGFPTWESNR